ncbi:MAG TPA: amidase [Clostridia bacterium]|nr:amidase [Clostridia bacterium]
MNITEKNLLHQMKRLNKAMLRAKELEGKSVVYSRKEVLEEAVITLSEDPDAVLVLFGVKNTGQLDLDMVRRLQREKGYLFHTVDRMAERGRAVDTDLINPLTGRVMTGSSSGGCVNILRGINDVAIGTDGGGSVLAPALSTGLYSIMAKGMGLAGKKTRVSTDNIAFIPGIGVISHSYTLCKAAITILGNFAEIIDEELKKKRLRIAVPSEGSVTLPGGQDMKGMLNWAVEGISDYAELVERDFHGIENRHKAVELCSRLFAEGIDVIMTAEGPVDLLGTGDSLLGSQGPVGASIQDSSGKYIMKAANMVDATAVTIPSGDLGMGIVLTGRPGIEAGRAVIALGEVISEIYKIPELFRSYFIEGYDKEDIGLI